jgi:hypothetical protein
MHRTIRALTIAGLLVLSGVSAVPVAAAEPPANDSIATPTVVDTFPYSDTIDTSGATTGATDPGTCDAAEFGPDFATVWYSWTAPQSGPIAAMTWGSNYDSTIQVGTANGSGGIDVLACNNDTRALQAAVRFDAVAGQTYLIVIGSSPWDTWQIGGELVFTLDVGPDAQAADATINPHGTFSKGTVSFTGTVSCAAVADLSSLLVLELSQFAGGREIAAGTAFLDIEGCPGDEIPFEIEVPATFGGFHPGAGTAQLLWFACTHFECANKVIDLEVTIQA